MRSKLIAAFVSAATIFGLGAGSAFAWTYSLSGTGACQDNGSFKITWTVDNTVESEALNITASSNSSVLPAGTQIAAHHSQTFTEIENGSQAGSFSLSLTGNFHSDSTLRQKTATVDLDHACQQPGRGGGEDQDVTLCHATDSMTSPYVKITVDTSGAYNGHYLHHQGPVFSSGLSGQWGDIIPPFTYHDHSYSLNWDSAGQAIYNNGCQVGGSGGGGGTTTPPTTTPPTTSTGGSGGGSVASAVSTSTTVATTSPVVGGSGSGEVSAVPSGGVNAGGGRQVLNAGSLAGLIVSIGGLGFGLRRLGKTSF